MVRDLFYFPGWMPDDINASQSQILSSGTDDSRDHPEDGRESALRQRWLRVRPRLLRRQRAALASKTGNQKRLARSGAIRDNLLLVNRLQVPFEVRAYGPCRPWKERWRSSWGITFRNYKPVDNRQDVTQLS